MMEIKRPKITFEENESKNYAKFVVEPLERGFGTTLGNSLRRVLLSSLPGAAAVGIKIDGVEHEFSTIKGVKEEITEIILNLKTVRFRVSATSEKSEKIALSLHADTVGPVTAGDIDLPADVEVLNPEQLICTLDEGGVLNMTIYVGTGRGYVPAERNKDSREPIGYIPIDSIFTPVTKANYTVESTRVEQSIDFDHRRNHLRKRNHFSRGENRQRPYETFRRARRQHERAKHLGVPRRRQGAESSRNVRGGP